MPKRIFADGTISLTKDEFMNLIRKDLRRKKLEEIAMYGSSLDDDVDELDRISMYEAEYSKKKTKEDKELDSFLNSYLVQAKEIIEEKISTPKLSQKVGEILSSIVPIKEDLPSYDIIGVSTKDGNEQLSFMF